MPQSSLLSSPVVFFEYLQSNSESAQLFEKDMILKVPQEPQHLFVVQLRVDKDLLLEFGLRAPLLLETPSSR